MKRKICIPGERIFPDDSALYKSGRGTYVTHGHIYSSLCGYLHVVKADSDTEPSLVEVRRDEVAQHSVPFVGSVVTAKVHTIGSRFAKCSILCVENSVLSHPFTGQIRKEDVRAAEKDKVKMELCYRPGDTILARVISTGDTQSSFLLSTAEDSLGTITAISEEGHKMVPCSWNMMECKITGEKEQRKVAKVPHLNSNSSSNVDQNIGSDKT